MKNFNEDELLDFLKDFQLKTVNYVYDKLYSENGSNKFLIADEVGLGKTMIARGIITKIINKFQFNEQKRLDIIYICSNSQIAKQNINKLNIMDKKFSHSSRITLLPLKIHDLKNNEINFISFTPGTSFNLRSSGGIKKERALLYHLLTKVWFFNDNKKYIKFFQCTAGDTWEDFLLVDFKNNYKIDEELGNNFISKLEEGIKEEEKKGNKTLYQRFEKTVANFTDEKISDEANSRRYQIIGELREILAVSCIKSLRAELVILDEFQRFKDLINSDSEGNKLFSNIFDNNGVKTLLLSATPYKMYTLAQESEDHYKDFIDTISVLFDSNSKVKNIKNHLNNYKNLLLTLNEDNFQNKISKLESLKYKIENQLKEVMVRNERVKYTENYDAMISENRDILKLDKNEVKQFLSLRKITEKMQIRNSIEYWKSSPYLLSFMENNYKLKEKINYFIEEDMFSELDTEIEALSIKNEDIEEYKKVDPANARLRFILSKTIKRGGWKLIWIPPSLPYYKSTGVYSEEHLEDFSKDLVFSAWKVVPRVISSVLSYAAERKMVKNYDEHPKYSSERKNRSTLLNFNKSDDNYKGMPVLNLIYPFEYFATEINPLEISIDLYEDELANMWDVIEKVKINIQNRLEKLVESIEIEDSSYIDERWYWLAPLILEENHLKVREERSFFEDIKAIQESEFFKNRGVGFKDHFSNYINSFKDLNNLSLGKMPNDLFDVLAKIAIAAPGVTIKRSLHLKSDDRLNINKHTIEIAYAFRNLFNRPENITLIRGLNINDPYWHRVLDYAMDGNIQSMLDEYVHILYESMGLNNIDQKSALKELKESLINSLSLRTVSLDYDELWKRNNKYKIEKNNIRCHYALKFGKAKNYQDKTVMRENQVREAFNSPFKPFVLATTSIGQEGLDFHQYCHSVIHWNLPNNPVDLEQREGRIHRYKGFVIRKNIAEKYKQLIYNNEFKINGDIWDFLFNKAVEERECKMNDMEPFWIFENDEGKNHTLERHIPYYPMSKESINLEQLKKSLAVYRMAFGQARQEDLINFIKENLPDYHMEELMKYRIDLSP